MNLPYYNSTNYPLAVKTQLSNFTELDDELKYHQHIVKEFFTKNKNQRGLLICHSMGQGKTRIAVAISTFFIKNDINRRVIVLSAKSLAENYKKEIQKYTNMSDEEIENKYNFISLNSSNMYKQFNKLDKTPDEILLEKKFGDFVDDVKNSLENSLLIIDEAHNFFNSITNGATNAISLYDLIMKTINIKLIFLSGTPVINHPFELVPCFNMLRGIQLINATSSILGGKREFKKNVKLDEVTLFSEDIDEFNMYFVESSDHSIKNKNKFTNRIYGLVSYYGDIYFSQTNSGTSREGFPTELETIIEKVNMSQEQFSKYMISRLSEIEETKKVYGKNKARFSSSNNASSTYRVRSRQISNYAIPDYALGPPRGNKSREKFIDRIKIDELIKLNSSPKMLKILGNIKKHKNQPGLVYSQFVSGEGLGVFELVLRANGYINYFDKKNLDVEQQDLGIKNIEKYKVYAVLSGEITPEDRANIINDFNQLKPLNNTDEKISLLLISGAVAEGIDLKRIRHVHIMEPFWNYARINQVKTRAIRYHSHIDLPLEEQNVQPYIYLSDYPANYPENKITEPTTDIDLFQRSIENMKLINTFMLALVEASMDCPLHYPNLTPELKEKINCKMCSPDNKQLYHPLLKKDMDLPDNCTAYKENNVSVNEIIIQDIKYYYKIVDKTNVIIYKFDNKINGYIRMEPGSKLYSDVLDVILQKINASVVLPDLD